MGEDRGRGERGESVKHVGGKHVSEAVDCSRPGLEVGYCAVASLPISLDVVIHIEGVDVVEEGPVLQGLRKGPMAAEVATDSKGESAEFP